jgi:hypothetical protein
MNAIDIARDLLTRNINPVPVPVGKKSPTDPGWQLRTITANNVEHYFNGSALNVGAQMGPKSNGLTDVDLDCREALALAPYFLPPTASKYGRPSKRKSHWLYTCHDPDPKAWYKLTDENNAVIVELRLGGGGKGSQSIWPGSIHGESRETYGWDNDGERKVESCKVLHAAIIKIAAATIVARHWPASNRHEASLIVGGLLARIGWDENNIGNFMVAVQEVAGVTDPAHVEGGRQAAMSAINHRADGGHVYGLPALIEFFGEKPALKIARLIGYRETVSPSAINDDDQIIAAVADINRNHALVLAGDKAAVIKTESETKFRLLKVSAFTQWYANQFIMVGNNAVAIGECWLQHPQRRQFEGIEFAPNGGRPGYYNMWQGFAVQPRKGHCAKFLAHLKKNVAQNNKKNYRWIIGWFAQIVQQPTIKMGTAITLRGEQGVGKTKVGEVFGSLFADHYALVDDPRYVVGQFNSHMASLLLLHADEAFWAGDKRAEGRLKNLVTGESHFLEFKGVDPIRVKNYIRLFVTGNQNWLVPAGFDERRFAIFDVGNKHIQDHTYFAAIDAEMNNGGREALLYHLLNFDLSKVSLRKIPKNAALFDQQVASFDEKQAWWLDTLRRGKLPDCGTIGNLWVCTSKNLYGDYIRRTQQMGARRRSVETSLGMFLNKMVPGFRNDRGTLYFPSLKGCRKHFAKLMDHEIEWDDPNADWGAEPSTDSI